MAYRLVAYEKASPDNFKVTVEGPSSVQEREAVSYVVEQLKKLITPKHKIDIRIQSMSTNNRMLGYHKSANDVYFLPTSPVTTVQSVVLSKIVEDEIFAKHINKGKPDSVIKVNRRFKWNTSHETKPREDQYDYTTTILHELSLHAVNHGCDTLFHISENEKGKKCAHWTNSHEKTAGEEVITRWMKMLAVECEGKTYYSLWSFRNDPVKQYQVLDGGKVFFHRTLNDNDEYVPENVVQLAIERCTIDGKYAFKIIHFHEKYEGTENGCFCAKLSRGFQQVELTEEIKKIIKAMMNEKEQGPPVHPDPKSLKPRLRRRNPKTQATNA